MLPAALLLAGALHAQEPQKTQKKYEFAKDRTISQTYNVSASDKLSINNQFGKVVIKTWARNEVKVDIRIEVSSTIKEKTEEMFEDIDVKHGKDGSTVYFKTEMKNREHKEKKDKDGKHQRYSNSINIDYEVNMPASLALNLRHQFGNTTLPDLQGRVDIDQQFGNLTSGRLSNPGKISVRFGAADIESVDGGNYDFQFTNNRTELKNATGDIKVNIQHCKSSGVVIHAANTNSIDVNAQHSDVAVVVPKDMSAQFNVDTHFGSFTNNSSFSISQQGDDTKRYGPNFNKSYKGSSGQGKTKIELDGNFTDFTIGHEVPAKVQKPKKTRSV